MAKKHFSDVVEYEDKYWICDTCAAQREWVPFKEAYTVISGRCGWCKCGVFEALTPLRDLKAANGRRADCVPEE